MRIGNAAFPDIPKIGYIHGEASRLNEKVVDGQWISYLNESAELVKIPPMALMKLFGGSIQQWHDHYPDSLDHFAQGLGRLCEKYGITTLYLNMPFIIPYVLIARNRMKLDLKVIFWGHSVASEFWLKLWIATAPWIRPSDILLCPSRSSKTALLNISGRYQPAHCLPHCIKLNLKNEQTNPRNHQNFNILSIGRIEDVKNIDFLIRCFAAVHSKYNQAKLTIAGEFTGKNREQAQQYQALLDQLIHQYQLGSAVQLAGPVFGEAKELCFQNAGLLINLSTDPGETFGYNLIEAKMWGLPVICTRWDGFREVVEDGRDGIFIDCRWNGPAPEIDERQTIDACLELVANQTYREKLGLGALKNAANYNYQRIIPRVLEVIGQSPEIQNQPDSPAEIALTPIRELPELYHLENLRYLELRNESPLSILARDYPETLPGWMARVKPIIGHFI